MEKRSVQALGPQFDLYFDERVSKKWRGWGFNASGGK